MNYFLPDCTRENEAAGPWPGQRAPLIGEIISLGETMSRRCELTGKAVQTGNLVSHSNHKTRTRFLPNLCNVTLISDVLRRKVRLRVTASALRSVEHRGGLDAFLVKARDADLSKDALAIKRAITKKEAAASAQDSLSS